MFDLRRPAYILAWLQFSNKWPTMVRALNTELKSWYQCSVLWFWPKRGMGWIIFCYIFDICTCHVSVLQILQTQNSVDNNTVPTSFWSEVDFCLKSKHRCLTTAHWLTWTRSSRRGREAAKKQGGALRQFNWGALWMSWTWLLGDCEDVKDKVIQLRRMRSGITDVQRGERRKAKPEASQHASTWGAIWPVKAM